MHRVGIWTIKRVLARVVFREDGRMKALIVQGGWQGHEPAQVAEVFRGMLEGEGFEVEVSDTLDAFRDEGKLRGLDLIVPIWTMGRFAGAVEAGGCGGA